MSDKSGKGGAIYNGDNKIAKIVSWRIDREIGAGFGSLEVSFEGRLDFPVGEKLATKLIVKLKV